MFRRSAVPTIPEPQRILLFTLLPIGDTLFALPAMQALRARYPAARIVALARPGAEAVLRCTSVTDEIAILPPAREVGAVAVLLQRLRGERFEVAIDFTSPAYKWISIACGIPERTYMKFDPLWWLLPGRHARWRSIHAARHYYDCAAELDLPPWETVDQTPRLALPADVRERAHVLLRQPTGRGGGPLIALHPGGAWLGGVKRWPIERFAAVAAALQEELDARLLILGDRSEAPIDARLAAGLRRPPVVAGERLPLSESLSLIEAADVFIGNDSGLLHAAAALGTPYVGIFGPTWTPNFAPLPCQAGQGTLTLPARPCRTPHYFVGGDVPWRRPCCHGTCAALLTISEAEVYRAAAALLHRYGLGVG